MDTMDLKMDVTMRVRVPRGLKKRFMKLAVARTKKPSELYREAMVRFVNHEERAIWLARTAEQMKRGIRGE